MTIALANSEIVVGRNRVALGLIGADNQPIADAQAVVSFFQLDGAAATKRGEVMAPYQWVEHRQRGVYVARVDFDVVGPWGIEVVANRGNGAAPLVARANLAVMAEGRAPMIGEMARQTRTLTLADVSDPTLICSNAPVCPLHQQSLDAALQSGRPVMVAFATPGFCTSLTCAPLLGEVLALVPKYDGRAEIVHVEIYKEPRDRVLADAVVEWQLPSEPWVFVIDRQGRIADRIEGIATSNELSGVLDLVL
jgi:hypothetical protein